MIVSNTVTAAVLDCVPLAGPWAVESTPGISPAKAVAEKTHVSVIAINNRFIDCSPLEFEAMQKFLNQNE
jgi:hypothetical protein